MKRADVNFEKKCGEISFDPDRVSEKELVKKINQIGFKAKVLAGLPSGTQC